MVAELQTKLVNFSDLNDRTQGLDADLRDACGIIGRRRDHSIVALVSEQIAQDKVL
jgi:hypothetical protein